MKNKTIARIADLTLVRAVPDMILELNRVPNGRLLGRSTGR